MCRSKLVFLNLGYTGYILEIPFKYTKLSFSHHSEGELCELLILQITKSHLDILRAALLRKIVICLEPTS